MKDYDYATFAEHYDEIEIDKDRSNILNNVIDKLLKKFKVKKILDMTCGTGVQVKYISGKGYDIIGSDLSKEMLDIAKKKCSNINFYQGDIRIAQYGKFDAVITIFNAIGHLSRKDFEKAINNISKNLNKGGIYIFDIFNLEFMKNNFINHEFIDVAKEIGNLKAVRFNNNHIDIKNGIMHINQKTLVQEGISKIKSMMGEWDMQIYSSEQLKELLEKNGFKVMEFLDVNGDKFDKDKNISILTVASKIK